MSITYENVLVTCSHGECCSDGQIVFHRLICPICENVIWIVGDEVLAEKPTEEWSTPDLKWEGTLTMRSHKCTCPDCGFVFESGNKCWVCGKGISFYHLGDAVFTEEQFQEMMEKKLNKCLVSKTEYIKNFNKARKQSEKKSELSIEMKIVTDEISAKIEEYKILKNERNLLVEAAKNYDMNSLPNELRTRILENIEKFKEWELRIQFLNNRHDEIKNEMNSINH